MQDPKQKRENVIRNTKINLILDAALKLFSEKGFHDTRLEDIAKAAGFSKASLYTYYIDKEAIFLNLAIRVYNELIDKLKANIDPKATIDTNLKKLLQSIFATLGEHASIFLTITNFMAVNILNKMSMYEEHQEDVDKFQSLYDEIIKAFMGIIIIGRKNGEIESPLDDMALTRMLGSLIRGKLLDWKLTGKIDNIEEAIDEILIFAQYGMGSKKRKRKKRKNNSVK